MTQDDLNTEVNLDRHKVTRHSTLYVEGIEVLISSPGKESMKETFKGQFDLVTYKFVFSTGSLSKIRRWGAEYEIKSYLVHEAIIAATNQVTEVLKERYEVQS